MNYYTKEELKLMTTEEILSLPKKCSRLHPYCLIGLHIDEVKIRMTEWCKDFGPMICLVQEGEGCGMNFNTTYYYYVLNKNNIMIDIYDAFDY
jgi:hypothetical protein